MSTQPCPHQCGNMIDPMLELQCSFCGGDVNAVVTPPPPTPSAAAVLTLEIGGSVITVPDDDAVGLGRSPDYPDAHIFEPPQFDNISRMHAMVRTEAGTVYVSDLGSTNGTFIDDVRLPPNTEYELRDDQRLRLAGDPGVPIVWRWETR